MIWFWDFPYRMCHHPIYYHYHKIFSMTEYPNGPGFLLLTQNIRYINTDTSVFPSHSGIIGYNYINSSTMMLLLVTVLIINGQTFAKGKKWWSQLLHQLITITSKVLLVRNWVFYSLELPIFRVTFRELNNLSICKLRFNSNLARLFILLSTFPELDPDE